MSQTAVIGRAAESFVIEGGRPLQGRIRASGNKNGALPILAACLLTAEPVVLHNVPRIVDVETMIELLNDIGVEADWVGPNDVQVHAAAVVKHELDQELCSRMRASFRSEEHTSELQSRRDLVCRLLLEKKKKKVKIIRINKKNKMNK